MIVLQLLGMLWAFVVPGVLVVWQLDTSWSPGLRVLVGAVLGLLTVPTLAFSTAWVLGTNVNPGVTLGIGTVLNVGACAVWWLRRRRWA